MGVVVFVENFRPFSCYLFETKGISAKVFEKVFFSDSENFSPDSCTSLLSAVF